MSHTPGRPEAAATVRLRIKVMGPAAVGHAFCTMLGPFPEVEAAAFVSEWGEDAHHPLPPAADPNRPRSVGALLLLWTGAGAIRVPAAFADTRVVLVVLPEAAELSRAAKASVSALADSCRQTAGGRSLVILSGADLPTELRLGISTLAVPSPPGGCCFVSARLEGLLSGGEGMPTGAPADPTPERLLSLSRREWEIAVYAAEGLSNAEIASRLHLSEATVKSHLMRIFRKIGVRRRSQLSRCFLDNLTHVRLPFAAES